MATHEEFQSVEFTIHGHQPRKSNSRRIVGRGRIIKSQDAIEFERSFEEQVKSLSLPYDVSTPVRLYATVYYRNVMADLSDELLADCLEKSGVLRNDNLIREKHLIWALDKENPRIDIKLEAIPDYDLSTVPKYKSLAEKALCKLKKSRKKK